MYTVKSMPCALLLYMLSLLVGSCTGGERDQGAIITVDFTQCLNTERAMKLSEIADTVEYLELKTPKEIIISRIGDVIYADGYWIVRSLGGISKFTKEGDWVQQIGRKGQGPGEYLGVRGIDFDPIRKEILVADAQQILFYDLDGNYIRNVKMVDDYFYNIGITDSVLWTGALGLHQEKHQVYAFNYKKDTLAFFPNPNYGVKVKNTDGVYFAHSRMEKEFYRYNGELYLKNRPANDTVFRLSSSKRIPYIVFDMGKYKLPIEYESWYSNEDYEKYASAYWGIPAVTEDDRFLFLLARRRFGLSKNPYERNEDDWRYIVYDKIEKTGFSAKGESGVRIEDDLLGGPAIWPRYITKDYYICTMEWYEMSEDVKAGRYPLSPALTKKFESFGSGTNELLVLCKRKNQPTI